MLRKALNIFVCVASICTPTAVASGGNEPNDTLAGATTTDLSGHGFVIIKNLLLGDGEWGERDVDVYTFAVNDAAEVPARVRIELESQPSQFDAYLRLFNSDGVELANNDDHVAGTIDPLLDTFLLTPGVYYVGVSTAANPRYDSRVGGSGRPGIGGAYDVTIMMGGVALGESLLEPNDDVFHAARMGSESFEVVGEFIGDGEHGRRDVDIYQLQLTGPARIDVEVLAGRHGPTLDPVVRLRHCTDSTEGVNFDPCMLGADDDLEGGSADASISVGLLESMNVFIIVAGAGNRRYDPTVAGSGAIGSAGFYDLIVDVTYVEISAPGEEPNDSLPSATRLSPFVSGRPEVIEVEGFIGDGLFAPFLGDVDVYQVTMLDELRTLTVDVAAARIGSPLDAVVVVYDAFGNRLATKDNHGASIDPHLDLPVQCVPVSEDAVSAYVMVMGTRRRPPNDPFYPAENTTIIPQRRLADGPSSTGFYRLTVSSTPLDQFCGGEPNDTLATATDTVLVNEGVFVCRDGLIGDGPCLFPENDLDVWSFLVTHPPVTVTALLSACGIGDLDCHRIHLFDDKAIQLAFMDTRYVSPQDQVLRASISAPGTYYVAVSGGNSYDLVPTSACLRGADCTGRYGLVISLATGAPGLGIQSSVRADRVGVADESLLFATRLDDASNVIDVLDAATGQPIASLASPESRLGGLNGLAYDGSDLYYLGSGWYPRLYRMDPASGDLLDDFILWTGSGFYSDVVMLGQELFLLDFRHNSIHVLDPLARRFVRTLPLQTMHGLSISGGLAALAGPNRLYVADAFNSRAVYEIDPMFGHLTNIVSPPRSNCCDPLGHRPNCCDNAACCNQVCATYPECCDKGWAQICGELANEVCGVCDVPHAISNSPTALAGIGTNELFVGDWLADTVEVIDRDGNAVADFSLTHPPGALAGRATFGPFGDIDQDGDADMQDIAMLQACFGQSLIAAECSAFDFDSNSAIDLPDFALFQDILTGP